VHWAGVTDDAHAQRDWTYCRH